MRALFGAPSELIVAFGVFAGAGALSAQVFTSSVTGSVTDSTGAVIPGAVVQLENVDTQETRVAETGQAGRFTFSQILPGTYRLRAESAGFKGFVRSEIVVRTAQPVEITAVLELGDVTETIEVTAAAEQLNTQSADRTLTLDQDLIQKLPVAMRNPFVQVHATAGVTAARTGISGANQDQNHNRFAMNGARDMSGLTLVDGAPSAAADWGGMIASPSVDSVQEVQLVRNAYDAQYGRSGGGVVSVVTRGGSNQFHGSVFNFLQNDNLNANSWQRNREGRERGEFKRNQFGANISGPILRDQRVFFFFAYEGLRQPSATQTTQTVPTALERQGDFSQSFNVDGSVERIFDPFTLRPNPDGSGSMVRDPFVNNIVPGNRIDPVAANVLALLPLPNAVGNSVTNDNNFFGTSSRTTKNDRIDARIDWTTTDKVSMYGRYTLAEQRRTPSRFYGNAGDTDRLDQNPRYSITYGLTWVPNPNWVANFTLTGGRWQERQISLSNDTGDDASIFGLPSSLVGNLDNRNVGRWNIDGFAPVGDDRFLVVPRETHSASGNFTKHQGSHSIKFGFQYELHRLNRTDARSFTFNFDRGMTSGPVARPSATTSGNSVASLLLGTGGGGVSPYNVASALTDQYVAFYLQDDWRMTNKLTLNLGVRFEVPGARRERHNRANYFDFDSPNPLGQQVGLDLRGGLAFVDDDNRAQTSNDDLNVVPRVGLAYKVTNKLVLRSGFGLSYMNPWPSGGAGTDGFSLNRNWVASRGNDGITPLNLASNPFPDGLELPAGGSDGLLTNVGSSVEAVHRDNPTPFMINYSVDIQYEVSPGSIFEVGYSGSQGRRLTWGFGRNLNQLPSQFLGLRDALNQQVANPFFGAGLAAGSLSGETIPQHRLLRLFPHFDAVNAPPATKGASSSFNALYVKFTHRFRKGLTILSSYQWSKALDNASEDQGWEVGDTARDVFDMSLERSVSAHDMPQSFVTTLIYELPVGPGKALGGNMGKAANLLIGGWQIAAVTRFNSHLPLRLSAANTLSPFGYNWKPVNIASRENLKLDNRGPDQWFNTGAVSQPGPFEIGNAMRYLPEVRGMMQRFIDFSLFKNVPVTERVNTEIRAEFFNLFNTPHFQISQAGCGNFCRADRPGAFGVMTSTAFVPERRIQLGLKVSF